MSRQNRSPYAQAQWERWEMEAFELPADHPNAPKAKPEDVDMETVLAEIEELKELAKKQGYAEGYAAGHQQGYEKGYETGAPEGHQQGYKKGLEQGQKEGYESGAQRSQTEINRLTELANSSAEAIRHLHEEIGQALLALAVDVAQHVLQTELKQYPEQLIPLINEVLADNEQSTQPITLLLHPDDISLVETHLTEDLEHYAWRLKADNSIQVGGFKVQSALGHVDATLETRWRRAIARLGPALAAEHKNAL